MSTVKFQKSAMLKFRFRKFQVYRDALIFRREIKLLVKGCFPKHELYLLSDQIIRAMNSIVLNIAEGADRSTDKDFANFLNKSHTSLNEVVSCLDIALMDSYITKEVHEKYLKKAEQLANQLTAFRKTLLSSDGSRLSKVKSQKSSVNGFTLIELILYTALVSIIISGAILFAWDIIYGRVKSQVQQEVNQNLRLASKRIVYEVRNASDINSVGANDLCLASADSDRNPTKIYVSSGRLWIGWGGGSSDCTGLTNDEPLTTNLVSVSGLNFNDLSFGESKNIDFTITVESTGDRQEWQKSQTYSSSVEVRSN